MNNFKSVPVESDTRITREQEVKVAKLPALHQNWRWEGIAAESIIFHAADVKEFTDDELFEKIKDYCIQTRAGEPGEGHTITRDSSGFTFVNFNFLTTDDLL